MRNKLKLYKRLQYINDTTKVSLDISIVFSDINVKAGFSVRVPLTYIMIKSFDSNSFEIIISVSKRYNYGEYDQV